MVAVRLVSLNLVHGHFKRWLAAIVGIELHAQHDCVATAGFHNKVSTVPESPWPKLDVEQKFEIQIQICNRFFCNCFWNDFFVQNVVRKQIQIWNLVLIFDPARGYNFVAIQLFYFMIRSFLNALHEALSRASFSESAYIQNGKVTKMGWKSKNDVTNDR